MTPLLRSHYEYEDRENATHITKWNGQRNNTTRRPVKRWLDGVRNDVNKLNLTITEANRKAQTRESRKEAMQRIASLNLVQGSGRNKVSR